MVVAIAFAINSDPSFLIAIKSPCQLPFLFNADNIISTSFLLFINLSNFLPITSVLSLYPQIFKNAKLMSIIFPFRLATLFAAIEESKIIFLSSKDSWASFLSLISSINPSRKSNLPSFE